MDRYQSFKDLEKYETEFSVESLDRKSLVTIVAHHGGNIEPHTTEIAVLIAGDDYNLFCLNGCKDDNNRDLHLTSHQFDHALAIDLVQKASLVIAVHGCTVREPIVYLGGLDGVLMHHISTKLTGQKIANECGNRRFAGTHKDNICNRGRKRKGVQLEISRGLRDSADAHKKIASAVQSAVALIKKQGEARELPLP